MWLVLAFTSAVLLGFYDVFKKQALKGRSVIAYPDLGAFDEWQLKLSDISKQAGFAVEVSPLLEGIATAQERAAGLDIADYLLQDRKAGNGQKMGIDSKLKTTLNNG